MKVQQLTAASGMETPPAKPETTALPESHSGFGVAETARTIGCAARLSAARAVARKQQSWTDRACAVFERGEYSFAVESYEGQIEWEGPAHCSYCARIEAIAARATLAPASSSLLACVDV